MFFSFSIQCLAATAGCTEVDGADDADEDPPLGGFGRNLQLQVPGVIPVVEDIMDTVAEIICRIGNILDTENWCWLHE
jgi:hypothetical protein